MGEIENIVIETQKQYTRSNIIKDRIIILLIVLMFVEAIVGYTGFVYYESQFGVVETQETEKEISIDADGKDSNATYNDVDGNQYNDNAIDKEGDR